ncbi:MAG TPA: Hsp20/alpha crystallin family protein [Noviherbaspirillum sp.]|nr:Hsp20/alpha crystallin family protein [Noviherbaspirillum sp.]
MARNLMNFNPFNELARFDPFQRFDDLFGDARFSPALREMTGEPRIRMDVTESDHAYTVKADMPGVKKEDIKIEIDGNQVTISAETKRESEERDGESVVRSERYVGQQYRSFTLASQINDAEVTAKYQDGVLELVLPKQSRGTGRKVTVS